MNRLQEVEKELSNLLSNDKKSWQQIYLLLKEVRDNSLFVGSASSFSQWVKEFAMTNHTHESILWNRMKAGKSYEEYKKLKEEKGESAPDIREISVSPDSLVLLEKIQKANPSIAAELVDKVMSNELTRTDLREAYQNIKEAKGINHTNTNPHAVDDDVKEKQEIVKDINTTPIKASDIVYYLSKGVSWYTMPKQDEIKRFKKKTPYSPKYKAIPEFAVYTGTTSLSRRIDCLCAENHSTKELWEINLHGIEIKVDKHDLTNDHKYTEYAEFVDYLWIAIPESLLEVAKENVPKSVGIVAFKFNEDRTLQSTLEREASRLNPLQRESTLASLVIRNI